jgi:hypothetical protein
MVQITPVLIVMAIDAEVLPVAAIGRIVIMVVVLVVHGEPVQILPCEMSPTPGTNPRVDFQGLLPVTLFPLFPCKTGTGHDLSLFFFADPITRFT